MWTQYISSTQSGQGIKLRHKDETESTSEHLNQTLHEIHDIIQFRQNELSEFKKTNQTRLDGTKLKVYS